MTIAEKHSFLCKGGVRLFLSLITHHIMKTWARADPGFVGPEACTNFGALFKKKITKSGMKVNIYFGPLSGPQKGPMQVRGPEAYIS